MIHLTAFDLVTAISQLPKDRNYSYVNPKNTGIINIVDVQLPEGPIVIARYNPAKQETPQDAKVDTISSNMIWRLANALRPHHPIHIDRVFGGSYNTRSVLESLLAYTPQFSYAYPGRIELIDRNKKIQKGHKHLIWTPDTPHAPGRFQKIQTEQVISEVPSIEVVYDSLAIPDDLLDGEIDIDVKRRHAQIQIALVMIAKQLGFRTWVAQNDKSIVYDNVKLGEMDSVIASLNQVNLLKAFQEAINSALLIDVIWFKNGKLMPAVMEIEHSTGVTSGLTRMKNLQDTLPPYPTRYVIVAPDDLRKKVIDESNKPQFRSLNARYFPYSAVEELYALCQKRNLTGDCLTEKFLDCYMEFAVNTN